MDTEAQKRVSVSIFFMNLFSAVDVSFFNRGAVEVSDRFPLDVSLLYCEVCSENDPVFDCRFLHLSGETDMFDPHW